jgi:ATP-dependent RNA helicase RhlE
MIEDTTNQGVSFAELDLAPEVLHAVLDAGYTHPTPIQQQAIPLAMEGRDLLVLPRPAPARQPDSRFPSYTISSARRSLTTKARHFIAFGF